MTTRAMRQVLLLTLVPIILGCGGILYDSSTDTEIGAVTCDGVHIQLVHEERRRAYPHLDRQDLAFVLVTLEGATDAVRMAVTHEPDQGWAWPRHALGGVGGLDDTRFDDDGDLSGIPVTKVFMARGPGDPVARAAAACGVEASRAFAESLAEHPALGTSAFLSQEWWHTDDLGPRFDGPGGTTTIFSDAIFLWPGALPPTADATPDAVRAGGARAVASVRRTASGRWQLELDDDVTYAELGNYVDEQGVDLLTAYGLAPDGTPLPRGTDSPPGDGWNPAR